MTSIEEDKLTLEEFDQDVNWGEIMVLVWVYLVRIAYDVLLCGKLIL